MRPVLFAFVFGMAFLPVAASHAQNSDNSIVTVDRSAEKSSFEEKYEGCMKESGCPLQLRLQLLNDAYVQSNNILQQVSARCAKSDYQSCVNDQAELQEWMSLNHHIQDLIVSLNSSEPEIAKTDK